MHVINPEQSTANNPQNSPNEKSSTKRLCKFHCPCLGIAHQYASLSPNNCSLLGQLHLVIDTLFASLSLHSPSIESVPIILGYIRVFTQSSSGFYSCLEWRLPSSEHQPEHMYPETRRRELRKTTSSDFSYTLPLSHSPDAFIFFLAKSVLTSFMIRSAKKSC